MSYLAKHFFDDLTIVPISCDNLRLQEILADYGYLNHELKGDEVCEFFSILNRISQIWTLVSSEQTSLKKTKISVVFLHFSVKASPRQKQDHSFPKLKIYLKPGRSILASLAEALGKRGETLNKKAQSIELKDYSNHDDYFAKTEQILDDYLCASCLTESLYSCPDEDFKQFRQRIQKDFDTALKDRYELCNELTEVINGIKPCPYEERSDLWYAWHHLEPPK